MFPRKAVKYNVNGSCSNPLIYYKNKKNNKKNKKSTYLTTYELPTAEKTNITAVKYRFLQFDNLQSLATNELPAAGK